MKVICKSRQCGATTDIIYYSVRTGIPIVTRDSNSAKIILHMAKSLGIENLPAPIPYNYKNLDKYDKVIVDDANIILGALLGTSIDTMVCDIENTNMLRIAK